MWIKSMYRNNAGEIVVYDDAAPENLGRSVSVSPETKPKRGAGFEHVDAYSDKLADDLAEFLNSR
jgi:hypothetical protein